MFPRNRPRAADDITRDRTQELDNKAARKLLQTFFGRERGNKNYIEWWSVIASAPLNRAPAPWHMLHIISTRAIVMS